MGVLVFWKIRFEYIASLAPARKSEMPAARANIGEARNFIGGLKAIGGTNIDEALEQALSAQSRKDRPYMIVFITNRHTLR